MPNKKKRKKGVKIKGFSLSFNKGDIILNNKEENKNGRNN